MVWLSARHAVELARGFRMGLSALTTVVAAAACREHLAVCDEQCQSMERGVADGGSSTGGSPEMDEPAVAGDGAGGGGGERAEGGSPASAACFADVDCDGGSVCDGVERCIRGRCEREEAPSCEGGTECDPLSSDGECVYTTQSPWLVLVFDDRVEGLPRHLLGARPLITLSESTSPFSFPFWAPGGKDLLVSARELDSGTSYTRLSFGTALPSAPRRLTDVPDWLPWPEEQMVFAPDGSMVGVADSTNGSLYLVSLLDPPAPTRRVESDIEAFCADPTTWLAQDGLVAVRDEQLLVSELFGWRELSPDARWVSLSGADAALVPCGIEAEPVPLGFSATLTWSSDSRFVAAELEDGSLRVLSIGPEGPVEVWRHPSASLREFSGDGSFVLVTLPDSERLSFVNLEEVEPAPVELPLDPDARLELAGPGAVIASWYVGDDDVPTLFYQPLRELEAPQAIGQGNLQDRDGARGYAVLGTPTTSELVDTSLVRFSGDSVRVDALATSVPSNFPCSVQLAPDGSGVIQLCGVLRQTLAEWSPLDPVTGDLLPKVRLGTKLNWVEMQPWR